MPTPQKEMIVKEMSEKFSNAKSIIMADFTGVDVNTINEVRKGFYESNVEYRVVKNTLAKLSLGEAGIEGLDEYLTGVNAYAIGYEDPTQPIKVFEKFKKQLDGKLPIKAAYFEGEVIPSDKVDVLAKLPTLDEARGKIVGALQAPMAKLVGVLQAPATKVVGVFQAQGNKESE